MRRIARSCHGSREIRWVQVNRIRIYGFKAEMDLIADEVRHSQGALSSIAVENGVERSNERVMSMRKEGLNVTCVTVPGSGSGVGIGSRNCP